MTYQNMLDAIRKAEGAGQNSSGLRDLRNVLELGLAVVNSKIDNIDHYNKHEHVLGYEQGYAQVELTDEQAQKTSDAFQRGFEAGWADKDEELGIDTMHGIGKVLM